MPDPTSRQWTVKVPGSCRRRDGCWVRMSFRVLSHDNIGVVLVAILSPPLPMALAGEPACCLRRPTRYAPDGGVLRTLVTALTRPPSRRVRQKNEQPPRRPKVGERISIKQDTGYPLRGSDAELARQSPPARRTGVTIGTSAVARATCCHVTITSEYIARSPGPSTARLPVRWWQDGRALDG